MLELKFDADYMTFGEDSIPIGKNRHKNSESEVEEMAQ